MSPTFLFLLLASLLCATRAQLQGSPASDEELSSLPSFSGESGLMQEHADGRVPDQVVQDFQAEKAVVSVLDDDSEASAPGPETKEDVVALLDKAVTFNETALLEAEQKSMEAFAYEDSCLRKITQRRWLYAMLRKNCTATRMSASFEAMRVFAALPQPVSRILPRFDNATQKFQIRSLSAALFRQSRREITLLEELKASRCRASPGCELAFDEVRKAREKDVATVRDRAAWSTVSHCIGKLRQKRACFKTWLEAFEALPTHTVDSVRTFVNDFTQAGRRKESAAIMQAVSAKVNATRIAFVQCGFSRECRRKAKNTIMHEIKGVNQALPGDVRMAALAQLRVLKTCESNCDLEKVWWRVLHSAALERSLSMLTAAHALRALSCNSTECVKSLDAVISKEVKAALRTMRTSSFGSPTFADSGIVMAGVVLCSIVLAGAAAVIVLGLKLGQIFQRLVWILVLGGVVIANGLFLLIWTLQLEPVLDPGAPWPVMATIAYCMAMLVKLLFTVLILLLLNLYLSSGFSRGPTIAIISCGALLSAGVIVVISLVFGVRGWSTDFAQYVSDPWPGVKVAPVCYMVFGTSVALTAICLLLAAFLLVLMVRALRLAAAERGGDNLRKRALLVNVILCGFLCLTFLVQCVCNILFFPQLGVESQALHLLGGLIVPTALLSLACLGLIVNAWLTSHLVAKVSDSSIKLLAESLSRNSAHSDSDIPSRYNDY